MNKSTYSYLVAGIGSALVVLCLLLPFDATQPLRTRTLEVLGPLLRVLEKPVNFFGRVDSKLRTLDEAQKELRRLHSQIAELEVTNQLLTDKAEENARLREMLGFREASPYKLRACRVISREPSSWWDSVQVNVGWADDPNLSKDQPVVTPRGIVGKTGTVSKYVTDVILLVNENCRVPAVVSGTTDQGIVTGQGNFDTGRPRVKVTYLPKDSSVAVGNFVITSGLGPYFPAGLRLGTVTEVPAVKNEYPTFGLYREAIIEPTADLNHLDELFVVLGTKEVAKSDDKNAPRPDPVSRTPPVPVAVPQ